MLRYELNPVQCIWYLFEKRAIGHAPMPNHIAVHGNIAKYRSLNKAAREDMVIEFEAEKQRFMVTLRLTMASYGKGTQSWSYALIDDSHGCSPLFRYCLARSEQLSIAENFEMPAIMQYMAAPNVYDETWGEWIPEDLKERCSCR